MNYYMIQLQAGLNYQNVISLSRRWYAEHTASSSAVTASLDGSKAYSLHPPRDVPAELVGFKARWFRLPQAA